MPRRQANENKHGSGTRQFWQQYFIFLIWQANFVYYHFRMIQTLNPIAQATLGTLFTWGMTAAGAAVVVFIHGTQVTKLIFINPVMFIHLSFN